MKKKIILLISFLIIFSLIPLNDSVTAVWWDSDWQSYVSIYIKKENIDEVLYDFPVLLKINSSITQHCNGGDSIRFLSSDNSTVYDYEIERWNSSGVSLVWVKIPVVYPNVDTEFEMYYNNSGASDAQSPSNVWSNNFTAVWHFNESSGVVVDSTGNGYNLTNNGATYVQNGHIGGGYNYDGINDYMNVSNFNPNDVGAISFITLRGCTSCGRRRFCGAVDNFEAVIRGDNYLTNHLYVLGVGILAGTPLTDTTDYHHLAFTWNYSNYLNTIYDDSILDASGYLANDPPASNLEFELAHSSWFAGEYYNGIMDEFRVHSIDRNSSWWKAEYENNNNASNFTIWSSPISQSDSPPLQYNEVPNDGGGADVVPDLFITVDDDFDRDLDVYFYSNSSGSWQLFATNFSVNTSTGAVILQQLNTNFSANNVTYWWSVNVTNGFAWNNKTYSFTTTVGTEPYVFNFVPADNSSVFLSVSLGVTVEDIDGHSMDIEFYTNASGTWELIGTVITDVYDGEYWVFGYPFILFNHTYYWKVKVTDEVGLTNTTVYSRTFKFHTEDQPEPANPCNRMMCCDDNYIYMFMGMLGLFGVLSIAVVLNKKNNSE